ncbi:type III effector protein [Ralstonia pseudosolanacearum]|uniref:type III effector protein n=1 Tax=Ralstonia pseudosolanacearum TaxID=1310165 RepID=UPI0023D9BE83|nr:type III effector protein [Ralstonia pseudosolanacearum]
MKTGGIQPGPIVPSPDLTAEGSPAPLTQGPTSTAPTTPEPRQVSGEHGGNLRRRAGAGTAMGSSMARRAKLPEAVDTVRNASLTRALPAAVKDVVAPAVTLMGDVLSTVGKAARQASQAPASSLPLQRALGGDLTHPDRQMEAHQKAVNYGEHSAQHTDRLVAFLHSVLRLGVAGTSMTFGLGRNAGLSAGDALGRAERGVPQASGIITGSEAPARRMSSQSAFLLAAAGVQQWALGSVTGAAGNLAGQFVAGPIINMLPRQFQAIDARAVVPQEIVELMNALKPGSGNALHDKAKAMQADIANISSESNVRLGQISFDSITAARMAAQSGTPLGVAGQISLGLAVSGTAGAVIGAVIAVRQSTATIDVPKADALRAALALAPANRPAELETHAVPLFFAKHATMPATAAAGDIETGHVATAAQPHQQEQMSRMHAAVQQVKSLVTAPAGAIAKAFTASPLLEPQPTVEGAAPSGPVSRATATVSNVLASGVRRTKLMAESTAMSSLMSTGSAMLAGATEGPARRAVLALGNAIGIHAAIRPWFNALASHIPVGDNAMRAERQQHVNAQALRPERPEV